MVGFEYLGMEASSKPDHPTLFDRDGSYGSYSTEPTSAFLLQNEICE